MATQASVTQFDRADPLEVRAAAEVIAGTAPPALSGLFRSPCCWRQYAPQMRIVDCSSDAGYGVSEFDSQAFTVTPLVTEAGFVAVLRLGPGGRIGRHPATGRQVFCVVEGAGQVSGSDRVKRTIHAGQAAVWEPGEEHETNTDDGMAAVVSEGPDLALLLPLARHRS